MIAIPLPDGTTRPPCRDHGDGKSASQIAAAYDAELVRQFKAGNEAAFVEIVARFRKRIFATAFSMVHNHADADDVTQDTFVRAYRGLAAFRGDSSLATWLHRIATNLSRNFYWYFIRRRCRDTTLSLDSAVGADGTASYADMITTDEPTPAHLAIAGEFGVLVTKCMDQLQAPHRKILTLRTDLDRSYAEIAAALGIEVGTVKSRIARARGALRRLMADQCPEFAAPAPLTDWFEPNRPSGRFSVPRN